MITNIKARVLNDSTIFVQYQIKNNGTILEGSHRTWEEFTEWVRLEVNKVVH